MGELLVRCDGSCWRNGTTEAKASISIFFEKDQLSNLGSLESKKVGVEKLIVVTDSEYTSPELTK